jgi:hypothetical protein
VRDPRDAGARVPLLRLVQVDRHGGGHAHGAAEHGRRLGTAAATTPLAPAADWTRFSVDLPAVPDGATAISPGFQFTQQTSFLVDDLELVDTVQRVDVTVQGPGRVTSAPAGVSCPTACAADFALGSTVTLTATPTATGGSPAGRAPAPAPPPAP